MTLTEIQPTVWYAFVRCLIEAGICDVRLTVGRDGRVVALDIVIDDDNEFQVRALGSAPLVIERKTGGNKDE